MARPPFSRDDYNRMLDRLLVPEPVEENKLLLERLRENIRKRKEFGLELPKLNGSLLGRS